MTAFVKTDIRFKATAEKDEKGNFVYEKNEDGTFKLDEKKEKIKKMKEAPKPIEKDVPILEEQDVRAILDLPSEEVEEKYKEEGSDEEKTRTVSVFPKPKQFLLDCLAEVVYAQAKEQITDETIDKIREEGFNLAELDWTYIANIPPGVRGASGIPKELWTEFAKDYVETMVHHGKTLEKAELGAKWLQAKLIPVRFNTKVLNGLKQNMALWSAHSPSEGKFIKIYEYLMNKLDEFLATDEDVLANSI